MGWAAALLFHAPASYIAAVVGVPLAICLLDATFGLFARTYLVKDSNFARLETAVELTFADPPGFHSDGAGYAPHLLPLLPPSSLRRYVSAPS